MSHHHEFPESVRLLAHDCYVQAGEDIDAACSFFRELCPYPQPANVAEFIHYWVEALRTRYSLHTEAHGRVSKVTDGTVERCVELVWEGYSCEGQHLYPLNMKDAVANIPDLARILRETGLKESALWQRMRRLEPALRRRHLVFKAKLSDEQKLARWECAGRLRRRCLEELRRVFWIDSTTIYVVPKGFKALVPPGVDAVIESEIMPKDYKSAIVLRFYCCVNAVAGPVAFAWHTGSAGYKPAKQYWVSAAALVSSLALVVFCSPCVTWHLHSAPVGVCRRVIHKTHTGVLLRPINGCPHCFVPAVHVSVVQPHKAPPCCLDCPIKSAVPHELGPCLLPKSS
jgi:hypothetical protein